MLEEGYDVDVVTEVSNDFYCVICLKLMRNPVQFKCGHGMCYSCYKYLTNKAKQARYGGAPCCPQCREIIKDQFVMSNTMLHRLILALQVTCPNEACLWIGEISSFEDHVLRCSHPAERSITSTTSNTEDLKKLNSRQKRSVDEHSDVQERLKTVELKLDFLTKSLQPLISSSQRPLASSNLATTPSPSKKNSRKKSSSSPTKTEALISSERIFLRRNTFRFLITLLFCCLLFWVMLYTQNVDNTNKKNQSKPVKEEKIKKVLDSLKEFHTLSLQNDSSHENTSILSAAMYSTLTETVNIKDLVVALIDKMNGLQSPNNYNHMQSSLSSLIEMKIVELQSSHESILQDVVLFYEEQNRSFVSLDKKLYVHIEQTRHMINRNITLFEENCFNTGIIKNVASLQPLHDETKARLNAYVFPEIDVHHVQSIEKAKLLAFTLKTKMQYLHYTVLRILNSLISRNVSPPWIDVLTELKQNITRDYNDVHPSHFIKFISSEIESMRIRHDHMLTGYYANISHAISYKQRLRGLLDQYRNAKFTPGMHLWEVNTKQPLDGTHAFISNTFHSVNGINSSMLLYKDQTKQGFWKVTFSQHEYKVDSNFTVSVWNQEREEVLVCQPSSSGELPRSDLVPEFFRFYSIPLSWSLLKLNGYIIDGRMLIKVEN